MSRHFAKGSGCFQCKECGKRTRETDNPDAAGIRMCSACYDYAGWENTHHDRDHVSAGGVPDCPICQGQPAPWETQAPEPAIVNVASGDTLHIVCGKCGRHTIIDSAHIAGDLHADPSERMTHDTNCPRCNAPWRIIVSPPAFGIEAIPRAGGASEYDNTFDPHNGPWLSFVDDGGGYPQAPQIHYTAPRVQTRIETVDYRSAGNCTCVVIPLAHVALLPALIARLEVCVDWLADKGVPGDHVEMRRTLEVLAKVKGS